MISELGLEVCWPWTNILFRQQMYVEIWASEVSYPRLRLPASNEFGDYRSIAVATWSWHSVSGLCGQRGNRHYLHSDPLPCAHCAQAGLLWGVNMEQLFSTMSMVGGWWHVGKRVGRAVRWRDAHDGVGGVRCRWIWQYEGEYRSHFLALLSKAYRHTVDVTQCLSALTSTTAISRCANYHSQYWNNGMHLMWRPFTQC